MTVTLWPQTSLAAIEDTARSILTEVGVEVRSAAARDLLLAAGCSLLADGRVAVPWTAVERAAESAPAGFTLVARDDARSLTVTGEMAEVLSHPLGGAHSVCDARTGERRRAQTTDAAAAARVQHHLERPELVTALFMPGDVAGDLEPLVSYLVCLQETDKCVSGPGLWSVEQVRGIFALAELVLGADPGSGRCMINLVFSPLSPLILGAEVADALIEAARLGASCEILPCPIAGTTGPAPIVAAVAQQTAEALVGVVLVEAARPGTPVICGSRLMPCDPRTGEAVMGGPELALAAQAATSIMRNLGLPSDVYGLSTDSMRIDARHGFERSIGALLAAIPRPAFISGMGFMQSGVGGSLEALVIDDEILRYITWVLEERPAGADALDLAAIKQAVSATSGFLSLRQTRDFLRSESVQRRLTSLDPAAGGDDAPQGDDLLSRAEDVVERALAAAPVGLDPTHVEGAADILAETAGRMGLEAPRLGDILERCLDMS